MDASEAVTFEAQGHVFQVKVLGVKPPGSGGKRGAVLGFSGGCRRRLLLKMARLDVRGRLPLFLTLTYPAGFPDCGTARRHRRSLEKRLGRRFPGLCWVWRLELQKRGAPHFHILLWGVPFLPVADIRAIWGKVIGYRGSDPLQIKVERLRSWRGVLSYVAKYMGKVQGPSEMVSQFFSVEASEDVETASLNEDVGAALGMGVSGAEGLTQLDYITYLPALFGRCWGVFRSKLLPFGEQVVFRAEWGRWFWVAKRLGRHVYPRIRANSAGFMLFRDNPYRWFDAVGQIWAEGG